MNIRRFIPASIKTFIRQLQRNWADKLHGETVLFAKPDRQSIQFVHFIQLTQEIKHTAFFENKQKNIQLSCEKINEITIFPGQIWSFWQIIGKPTLSNGFKMGRNIVGGKLSEAIGGGLCQTSSIVYHLSLMGGLKIIERFNHTIDIYTDETRFTPLGADATVVYGHKDLRIQNVYDFPIKFLLKIKDNLLVAQLWSMKPIEEKTILFVFENSENLVKIVTTDFSGSQLAVSIYEKLKKEA